MKLGIRFLAVGRARCSVGKAAGFTIVETMIVLAITGGLFVAIAATLAGRQNSAEFTHAIQTVQAQIQQTVNQVSAGFYPNDSNFSCTASGAAVVFSNGSTGQGANQDCVFLGKVLQFNVQGASPEQFQTYTVAGLRGPTIGATSPFQNVSPTVVGVGSNYANYSTATPLEYGLSTVWMKSGGTNIGSVGLLMEPGDLSSSSASGYTSGAQQIDIIPLPGTSLGQSVNQGVISITNSLRDVNLTADAPINPAAGVQICFASGATNQSGLVTIGGSGRQLLVTLDIRSNKTCS